METVEELAKKLREQYPHLKDEMEKAADARMAELLAETEAAEAETKVIEEQIAACEAALVPNPGVAFINSLADCVRDALDELDEKVAALVALGVNEDDATNALEASSCDVDEAKKALGLK